MPDDHYYAQLLSRYQTIRRFLTQIDRGEGRHAVARAVIFGQKGQPRKKYGEGQEDQLGAPGLVVTLDQDLLGAIPDVAVPLEDFAAQP